MGDKDTISVPTQDKNTHEIDTVTLGMFIIDEIHFASPKAPVFNILGGAGSYAALGARIFSPAPTLSRRVGWIVDEGSDFPDEIRDVINSWNTSCKIRSTPERLTTRGWNGYEGADEKRAFRYMTPKLRLDHEALDDHLLRSKTFHIISSPSRCIDLVSNITQMRRALGGPYSEPIFIWEPVPDLCVPDELAACYEALKHVQVVSPNHAELCGFFDVEASDEDGSAVTKTIEECCNKWLSSGIGANGNGAIVIRSGKDGCYVATGEKNRWLPAYHQNPDKVIDPTGGGNSFLGGLAIGLARGGSLLQFSTLENAAMKGSVSASFAIEQVGMPKLSLRGNEELWNGEVAVVREEEMLRRLGHNV